MTTTRYFEVKVTNCQSGCPHANLDGFGECEKAYQEAKSVVASYRAYDENKNQITDSCPMWDETKESETK